MLVVAEWGEGFGDKSQSDLKGAGHVVKPRQRVRMLLGDFQKACVLNHESEPQQHYQDGVKR